MLFIQKAASSLKVGRHVFLDVGMFSQPEVIFSKAEGRVIFEGTDSNGVYGKHTLIGDGYDIASQVAFGRRVTELIMPDGNKEIIKEDFAKYIPTLDQVHGWLEDSGFKIIYEYGDYTRNPISDKTYKAIIWAERIQ